MRLASLLCLVPLTGCALYFDEDTGGGGGHQGHDCDPHTATIFEPADGATVAPDVLARFRWNESGIPDRYMAMEDDFGNFFTSGATEVLGDGSIEAPYALPANGHFTLTIGWYCDAGAPDGGVEIPLARVSFFTSAR